MAKDHYQTLGIQKGASKDEIKKAFRKLAHEYHPDKKGGDEAKFKEVNEAYSILSDDQKKSQYDTYGNADAAGQGFGGGGGQGFGGFDFSGFQGGFQQGNGVEFDLGDIFGDIFGGGGRSKTKKGADISVDIELTFEESIFGVDKIIILNKVSTCDTCSGSGAKRGTAMDTCSTCSGKGQIQEMRRSIIGSFASVRQCETCHGTGKIPKEKCETCHGAGVTKRDEDIKIPIPSGIENGETLSMRGYGEAIPGGTTGDLYIRVHVKKHPTFRKEGSNLVMDLHVKLSDALLGTKMDIKTLDGNVTLTIPEGTNFFDVLRMKERGVPMSKSKRGDILVRVIIDMPKKISKDVRKTLEDLKERGV